MKIDAPASPPALPPEPKKARSVDDAARQFEAIFVRSLLAKSPMAGKDAYGDMAVDALANAVTAGKGLGLGDLIKKALEKSDAALKKDP